VKRQLADDLIRRSTRYADAAGSGEEGPHDDAVAAAFVHAEEGEGIAMGRSDDPCDLSSACCRAMWSDIDFAVWVAAPSRDDNVMVPSGR
jgi:hypothetical protein